MNDLIPWLILAPVAYLVGSIPVGIIVSRVWGGVDPREHGSGSMGTTNVLRTVGKKAAAFVLLFDFGKGVGIVWLSIQFAEGQYLLHALAGTLVIVGHTWPVFAGFKGGKGIATGWGAILVLSPVAGALTFIGLIVAAATRYVSLGSIIGASSGVAGLIVICIVDIKITDNLIISVPTEYLAFAIPSVALVLYSHRENLVRLFKGTENRLDIAADPDRPDSGNLGA